MTDKFRRRYWFLLMILVAGFLIIPEMVVAQEVTVPVLLMKVDIKDQPDRTAVTIITDDQIVYQVSEIEEPPLFKIIVDLANTRDGWNKSVEVKKGVVLTVRSGQYQETPPVARVVVDLVEKVPYRVLQEKNEITVEVDNPYPGEVSPRMAQIIPSPVPTVEVIETPAPTAAPVPAVTPVVTAVVTPAVTPVPVYRFTGIEVKEVENQVEIYLNLDGKVKYRVVKVSPLSIVVDLPDTENRWTAGRMTVEKGAVARVRSSQWKTEPRISRVVLDLSQSVPYQVTTVGNRIRVAVSKPAEVAPPEKPVTPAPTLTPEVVAPPRATPAPVVAPAKRRYAIMGIEIKDRPAENRNLVIISADGPIDFQVEKQPDPLVIAIYIPQAEDQWKKDLRLRDEGALLRVTTVSVDRPEKAVKVLIGLKRPVAFYPMTGPNQVLVYVDKYLVRPPEVEVTPAAPPVKPGYVTVSFAEADIRDVIALFAEIGEVSVIAGPEITGKVTCTFKNEPWQRALARTLEVLNFGYTRDGKILLIKTLAKLKEEEEARKKAEEERLARIRVEEERRREEEKRRREEEEALKQYVPMVTERIDLNYTRVEDVGPLVQNLLSGRGRWQKFGNSLLVTDIPEKVKEIKALVAGLDKAEPEVLITVKIAVVDTSLSEELGIQWTAAGGNVEEISSRPDGGTTRGTLRIGTLTTGSFTATINALRAKDLIRSSRDTYIRVKNNLAGTITETVSYPYPGPAEVGWAFANVVTTLTATPHVNPAEEITLELSPTISDVIATTVGGPPTTRTSSTTTTTRVKNGETIVIGGLLQSSQTTGQTGVPLLSQIPIFGVFFRASKAAERASQILLFITPQIIKEETLAS